MRITPTARTARTRPARPTRRPGTLATASILVAAVVVALTPAASAHHAPGPCDAHRGADETVRQYSRRQIRCAARRWDVPGGAQVALCIAKRESGLLPWAESADGMNKGLFQQHVNYWDGNYEAYTRRVWDMPTRILSGRTNAVVSIRMAHAIGWKPWGGRDCG